MNKFNFQTICIVRVHFILIYKTKSIIHIKSHVQKKKTRKTFLFFFFSFSQFSFQFLLLIHSFTFATSNIGWCKNEIVEWKAKQKKEKMNEMLHSCFPVHLSWPLFFFRCWSFYVAWFTESRKPFYFSLF